MMPASEAGFGIAPSTLGKLGRLIEETPGIERVWIFGSRARGTHRNESDIDLAVEVATGATRAMTDLSRGIEEAGLFYRVDLVSLQDKLDARFRSLIERDRKIFWEPRRHPAEVAGIGGIQMKPFQSTVLDQLARYLDELKKHAAQSWAAVSALQAMEGMEDLTREAADFPKKAWAVLKQRHALPPAFAEQPYSSRWTGELRGAGRAIPNVCLKVPTGGGKTLLAAASVAKVFTAYLNRHTGLVLWVVPNEAIYRQTLKALSDRDHPYRQILNVAGAGRVKVLEKNSPLTRLDVDSHLCVMLLMLQSAARQSKETLRFFRDRGNVLGFLPREDDIEAHWDLLGRVPNLDVYAAWGASAEEARAQKGSIVKSSLGNVMRLLRPMVVIDESQHSYSETALRTLDGFNPCFMLELSATPRVAGARGPGSNILVDVRGVDLDEAEMIKLPIQVDVKRWTSWQSCLAASVQQLDELQREASALQAETARYIRPILLVQVERTGADMRDAGFIHAEDAKAYLMQLGFSERQIAIKTSDKNELKQPENIDLLSPACEVRAIITKAALQEGWDCPFAYVLCALAAGRAPAAMTQLVGRILRLPHVAKTGRAALDACYVQCYDANTADVVRAIKKSLEGEGMGDLAVSVRGDDSGTSQKQQIALQRRPQFAHLRLFLPKVTWAEPGAEPGAEPDSRRRELVYDSDVLAHVDWAGLDVETLARNWAPNTQGGGDDHLSIDLSILNLPGVREGTHSPQAEVKLDRARLVRALIDLAPNAWLVWDWVAAAVKRLRGMGFSESALAGSSASLIERLRIDIECERDRLAQSVFEQLVQAGRIQFRLRADATDYELPTKSSLDLAVQPPPLQRPDARVVEKSLLEPALRSPDMNEFEVAFAGYLDQKAALQWWHRNVAKTQYGLQGWKRQKVYPDFVFALVTRNGRQRTVVMETKGLHLEGFSDTAYKQALLERLTAAFQDERLARSGELVLESAEHADVVCDLVFDQNWPGTLEHRYFSG
jgi:type III restriction enzyme